MSKDPSSSPKTSPLSPEEYVANLSSVERFFARIEFWMVGKFAPLGKTSFEEVTLDLGRCRGTPALRVWVRFKYWLYSPFWRLKAWLRRGSRK